MKDLTRVFIVMKEEENVVYASVDYYTARGYADAKFYEEVEELRIEQDIDDDNESENDLLIIKVDCYKVFEVDLSDQDEYGSIELNNGDEVEVSDILAVLDCIR